MRLMFPYKTKDGWSNTPDPQEMARISTDSTRIESGPKKALRRTGFFKDGQLPRHAVRLKVESARLWLESLLHRGPLPSREVYRLAKLEGISARGVRRAKRYHGIRTVKTGGRQRGWGAQWIWHFPVSN
jgi:hypothetical protein